MTQEQRFYILVRNGLGAAFVNALLNGALGWAATRGLSEFPVWKVPGVAVDLLVTAFGVTFGTCLVLPFQTKKDFARGRATLPAVLPAAVTALLSRFPKALLQRSVVLGLLSVPLFAPPALLGLAGYGGGAMERWSFVELKASFSAIQGGLVTPLIVLAILSDLSARSAGLPSLSTEPS